MTKAEWYHIEKRPRAGGRWEFQSLIRRKVDADAEVAAHADDLVHEWRAVEVGTTEAV